MNRIHPNSFGIALGSFLAMWHTLWALLVWVGAAQRLIDFISRLHMITPPYKVSAFGFVTALALVLTNGVHRIRDRRSNRPYLEPLYVACERLATKAR
jgi:hypothetical protein